MSAFQKECEARLRAEMDEQVRRVRDYEVGQARLEEAAKHRRHLADARREELERVHAERLRKLRAREESQMERVRSAEAASSAPPTTTASVTPRARDPARGEGRVGEGTGGARDEAHASHRDVARRESEMTTKEQAWSLRYAEASAEAEERRDAPPQDGRRRRTTPRDGHLGDGGHRGGAR